MNQNRIYFLKGIKNGLPIALGYLAVAFTLGIAARNADMTAWQATLTRLAALAAGIILAWCGRSLFQAAVFSCLAGYILELFL